MLTSLGLAVLRFCLIGVAVDNIVLLLIAQSLHAATFGSFHAASVNLNGSTLLALSNINKTTARLSAKMMPCFLNCVKRTFIILVMVLVNIDKRIEVFNTGLKIKVLII